MILNRIHYIINLILILYHDIYKNMAIPKFHHPKDIKPEPKKKPISTRISLPTHDLLNEYAKRYNLKISDLISRAIYDYVDWLEKEDAIEKKIQPQKRRLDK